MTPPGLSIYVCVCVFSETRSLFFYTVNELVSCSSRYEYIVVDKLVHPLLTSSLDFKH